MPGLPKALHLAKSWEKLKEMAEVETSVYDQPEKRMISSAATLYQKVLQFKREGDEEKLYVFCSRFCTLVTNMRKKYGKRAVNPLLRNYLKVLECLEDLSDKLPQRYESIAKKDTAEIVPSSPLPAQQPFPKDPQPTDEKGDVPNGVTGYQFIKPKQLFDWLNCHLGASDVKKSVLIIDVRSAKDYENSHIKSDRSINCPEEIITVGKAASHYGSRIQPPFKILWEERKSVDHLVLMDWSTTSPDVQDGCPLDLFKEVLEEWDPGRKYVSPPYILDGGFEMWTSTYPNWSTRAHVQAPSDESADSFDIHNISFPSLSESPNDGLLSSGVYSNGGTHDLSAWGHILPPFSSKPPLIDRSSKANAELPYKRSKQDQDKLEKDLDESKSMLNSQNQKIHNSEETKELLEQKEQLEAKLKAFEEDHISREAELERLRRQLEEYEQRERVATARQVPKPSTTRMTSADETINRPKTQFSEKRESKERPVAPEVSKDEATSNGLSTIPLNQDNDSIISRSHSRPNIAQTPAQEWHRTPTYDRSNKPVQQSYGNGRTLLVYGSSSLSGLTGLRNLGNTCYMNSIIQCISNTSKLADYFCSGMCYYDINESRTNPTRGEVAGTLALVIQELWSGKYKSTGCVDLKKVVGRFMESFAGTSQQDSHEFLTFLMDWLHKDLCRTPYNKQVNRELLSGPNMAWTEYKKAEDSIISELFFIQQVSTVVCTKCHEKSVTYEEPTSNLTLQLPSVNGRSSLESCLSLYTSGEQISGYRCESCEQTNDATKKVDLWRLPQILVIHLKRFYSDGLYHKRQTLVEFPLEGLEMRDFTSNPESGNTKYNLYAVSNHYGTLEGGHYTAFCKNKGLWYKFDDQDVTETTPGFVKSSNAYILFYEKM